MISAMAKIVLFVDAMEPTEYGAGWTDTERGLVESGYPKVTPKVTSEVYTGESPSKNGMGAVHSMSEANPHRPQIPTIQEKLEMAGFNVASLHMPYCLPLQMDNGAWISTAMQQQDAGQNPITRMCMQPPAGGDMSDAEADWDRIFNSKREDIYAKSSSMLNAINMGEFDVMFLAIRSPDEYTHFQWHEPYRKQLLEALASEVSRWEVNHDILWWSDHGSEEKKETFRVNKWLMDKGYLDLDIDMEFAERFEEEMMAMQPQDQQRGQDIENQLGVQQAGVEIGEDSQALCMDPYDSCIDVIDDDLDEQELIDDMMDTGMYAGVERAEDRWGEGQHLEQCPDLVTLREDNVLVTGNVHPEPIGMGFMRTGVHSRAGAWGTTDDSLEREGDVTPKELHDVIWEFVTGKSQMKQEVDAYLDQMQSQMEQAQEDFDLDGIEI